MRSNPIFCMGESIGSVETEACGLYLHYRASLRQAMPVMTRLYYHTAQGSCTLGIFAENCCDGRKSLRSLWGFPTDGFFSADPQPWRKRPESRFPQLPSVPWQDGLCYAMKRQSPLQEALPYFCFYYPTQFHGQEYFCLHLDGSGTPQFLNP